MAVLLLQEAPSDGALWVVVNVLALIALVFLWDSRPSDRKTRRKGTWRRRS